MHISRYLIKYVSLYSTVFSLCTVGFTVKCRSIISTNNRHVTVDKQIMINRITLIISNGRRHFEVELAFRSAMTQETSNTNECQQVLASASGCQRVPVSACECQQV